MNFDQAFFSQSFLQNIFFLGLTALITGFGVPLVLKMIEDRKLRQQKKFEADLARQGKILEAQSKLLDDVTTLLWKWRYLAKKVVYYGADKRDTERYKVAKKEYDEKNWDLIEQFRVEISRSRRLASERAYNRLNSLYEYIVGELDVQISDLISSKELDVKKSKEIADTFSKEVSKRLDHEIDDLASELNLKVKAL
jgi:F0F1-type ATP synthase membrane subunit b/b'